MTNQTITVSETAAVQSSPELATVRARTRGTGASPGEARTAATDLAAIVREALAAERDLTDRVRTTNIECSDQSEAFGEYDADYVATTHLTIECVPDEAGDIVVTVTDAGGTVSEAVFELTDETRHSLIQQVNAAAVEQARETATAMAAAEGLGLGTVVTIEQEDPEAFDDIVSDAIQNGPDTVLAPSPVTLSADVTVTYELVD